MAHYTCIGYAYPQSGQAYYDSQSRTVKTAKRTLTTRRCMILRPRRNGKAAAA